MAAEQDAGEGMDAVLSQLSGVDAWGVSLFGTWLAFLVTAAMLRIPRAGIAWVVVLGGGLAASFSPDPWAQWGAIVAGTWGLAALCLSRRGDAVTRRTSVSSVVGLAASDLLWMCGLLALSGAIPFEADFELSPAMSIELLDRPIAQTAIHLLLAALVIRSGLFPLNFWTAAASGAPWQTCWTILGGFGVGLVLLAVWLPVLTAFQETRTLMAGLGALSALLLAVSAWAKEDRSDRLLAIAGSQLGLVWIGVASHPAHAPLSLATGLSTLILIAWISCEELSITRRPAVLALPLLAAIGISSGLLGQERILEASRMFAADRGGNPWILWSAVLFAQAMTSFLLFQIALGRVQSDPVHPSTRVFARFDWLRIPLMIACAAFPVWQAGVVPPSTVNEIPMICLLLAGICGVAAWIWLDGLQNHAAGLRRLGAADFHAPRLIQSFAKGLGAAAAMSAVVLDAIFFQRPAKRLLTRRRAAAELADQIDDGLSEPGAALWSVAALAVLLIAIGLSAWLKAS